VCTGNSWIIFIVLFILSENIGLYWIPLLRGAGQYNECTEETDTVSGQWLPGPFLVSFKQAELKRLRDSAANEEPHSSICPSPPAIWETTQGKNNHTRKGSHQQAAGTIHLTPTHTPSKPTVSRSHSRQEAQQITQTFDNSPRSCRWGVRRLKRREESATS
jgi:hypothetical protein